MNQNSKMINSKLFHVERKKLALKAGELSDAVTKLHVLLWANSDWIELRNQTDLVTRLFEAFVPNINEALRPTIIHAMVADGQGNMIPAWEQYLNVARMNEFHRHSPWPQQHKPRK